MSEQESLPTEVKSEEEEMEEIDTSEGDKNLDSAGITNQLMRNPQVLAALQDRLGGMVGTKSGYIQTLPKVVKRRIKALKKLQFETLKIESEFYEEFHELELKYASKYSPLYARRSNITTGSVEPTDSDCDWPSEDEDDLEIKQLEDKKEEDESKLANALDNAKIEDDVKKSETEQTEESQVKDEDTKGIPEFWLTIFKNVEMLNEMIEDHDEPILKHLKDIRLTYADKQMGFKLDFEFEPNEYFTQTLLTKEYTMRNVPDSEDPFSYEGPEITKCKGCTIDWNKGKNVTVKVVKKIQKHKGRGTKRTVTKTVQNDSFFNFFSPPDVPEGEEADDDTEAVLAADYEIGHFLRDRVVPRAVLYFTGEALDDDYDEDEEEEDEEEEDSEEDPDYAPPSNNKNQTTEKPADCKQQ